MNKRTELAGRRVGLLTAIYMIQNSDPETWHCVCDCGNTVDVSRRVLLRGTRQSCGCAYNMDSREKMRSSRLKHGKYGTRLYNVYYGMIQRCYYEKHIDHEWYASRGIGVCDEWRENFDAFYDWAISTGYRQSLSLDRVDNDLGYSPDNCRWSTPKEQANNRRSNIRVTYNGETKTLKQWAEESGVKYGTVYYRYKHGLPFDKVLEK